MLVLLGVAPGDGEEEGGGWPARSRRCGSSTTPRGGCRAARRDREILCVSQFTLYGDVRKGNRPSFTGAAPPEQAEPLYDLACDLLGAQRGEFGAAMEVELVNDGPITLLVEV